MEINLMLLMLLIGVIASIIAFTMKIRPTKVMLLGIAVMIIPIYVQNESGFKFYGYEFYILVFGFILVLVGLFMKDENNKK